VQNAEEEGVDFVWLSAPGGFEGNPVSGVTVQKMRLGQPDATGRQSPELIEGADYVEGADLVIKALGFSPEDLPTHNGKHGGRGMNHNTYTARAQRVHRFSATQIVIMSAFLTVFGLFAASLSARENQRTFSLPEGCTAYLTVQSQDCSVDHHFTCEGDPEGHKQRISLTEDGVVYVGSTNFESEWVGSFHPRSGYKPSLAVFLCRHGHSDDANR